MAKDIAPYIRFNGGEAGPEISPLVDLEKYRSTAKVLENWMPVVQGEMHFRHGTEWRSTVTGGALCVLHPFVFNATQRNGIAFTANVIRVLQDGDPVVRPTVTAALTSGDFSSSTGWTDVSASGATATIAAGKLKLVSDGAALAGMKQALTINEIGTQHALNIVVDRGPVTLLLGTTDGGSEITNTVLRTGSHCLAFTPAVATVYIRFTSVAIAERYVDSITVASAGDLVLTSPWGESELRNLAFAQSNDVLFIASGSVIKKRLERRGASSWSLVDYNMEDGPFLSLNVDESLTLTPSVLKGNGTLTASRALFKSTHVGGLWKIIHAGQTQSRVVNGAGQFTDPIKVTGTGARRYFSYTIGNTITGTWAGTITLQQSIGNTTSWVAYLNKTVNGTFNNIDDGLDNQIVYYRLGFESSNYTSGSATVTLDYKGGTTTGICRAIGYTSSTVMDIEVVQQFGEVTASYEWYEGAWSAERGWPEAIAFFDERLYTGVYDGFFGSVTGAYESMRTGSEAADAISRKVATGGANPMRWIAALSRLVVGTEAVEAGARSTNYDEPITATNLTIRNVSTRGSARVQPVLIDAQAFFIARDEQRAYAIFYSIESSDFVSIDLMELHKRIGRPGIVQMAVQRHPDTRVYMIRADGQCVVLLYEPGEKVKAWGRLITDGAFESVMVLPSVGEDEIYFSVRRTINGATVRYIERMAPFLVEDAADARYCDSHKIVTGTAMTEITGADHLEGREVVIWADGAYHPPRTVTGGRFALARACDTVVYGLGYEGAYMGQRINAGQGGVGLNQQRRPFHLSLLLRDSAPVLWYGNSLDDERMQQMSDRMVAQKYDAGPGLVDIQTLPLQMDGGHSRDPRLCLKAKAPYGPVIVQAALLGVQSNEKA